MCDEADVSGALSSLTLMKALVAAGVLGSIPRKVFLVAELGQPVRLYIEDDANEQRLLKVFAHGMRVVEVPLEVASSDPGA